MCLALDTLRAGYLAIRVFSWQQRRPPLIWGSNTSGFVVSDSPSRTSESEAGGVLCEGCYSVLKYLKYPVECLWKTADTTKTYEEFKAEISATLLEKAPSSSPSSAPWHDQQEEKKEVLILAFQFSVNLVRCVMRRS
jgi:hypothetical protein